MQQQNINGQNYPNQAPETNVPVTPASEPVVPTAAPSPAVEEKKAKSKKPVVPIIIAILLIAALAVGGFFAYQNFFKKDDVVKSTCEECGKKFVGKGDKCTDCGGIVLSTCKECGSEFEGEGEICHECQLGDPTQITSLAFYPDRKVTKKDLEAFSKIIEERVKILGSNYDITVDDEKIVLFISKTMLGTTPSERSTTVELLTSNGAVSFGENGYIGYQSPEKKHIKKVSVKEYSLPDLLSDHKLYMVEERYNELEAIKESKVYGVQVEFSKDGADILSKAYLSSYDDSPKFTIIHDYSEDDYGDTRKFMGTVLFPDEDDTVKVDIISPAPTYKKIAELTKMILEQKKEMDFSFVVEIVDEPNWETEGKRMGKNQKAEMSGETIFVEFTPSKDTLSYRSEVEFAEYEKALKERMDVLGIDYMFGTAGFDDKTYCIKVNPENFAPDFFRMIFRNNNSGIFSSFSYITSFSNPKVISSDGKYGLRYESFYSPEQLLEDNNIPGNTIYLAVNDVTIASADISQLQPVSDDSSYDYSIDFTNFLCFGDIEVSENEEKFLDLICHISEESSVPTMNGTFRFRSTDIEGDDTDLSSINWKYDTLQSEDKKVFETVTAMGYSVQKQADERNKLVITLDLEKTDELPQKFLDETKAIYEACNFASGAYNEVQFVIADETLNSPANKFRIFATKSSYDQSMTFNYRITGPDFSDYWLDAYDMWSNDPLFGND